MIEKANSQGTKQNQSCGRFIHTQDETNGANMLSNGIKQIKHRYT